MKATRREAFLALVLGSVVGIAGIECVGRTYAYLHPSYDVLFLQPDRVLGWKQVPGLRWSWAGSGWYAMDFSVDIETNSHGFRDAERTLARPEGTTRIALLGDSLVEAAQVPLEKTAGALLERRLNAEVAGATGTPASFEVLNFGITNYSVGQFLLVWEEYANRFDPDFVFVLVDPLHMRRTTHAVKGGAFTSTRGRHLHIRPTFEYRDGQLVRHPATDYAEFVELQERLIRGEFNGSRMRRKPQSLSGPSMLGVLWSRVPSLSEFLGPPPRGAMRKLRARVGVDKPLAALNLRILAELGRQVERPDAQLILVDVSRYFSQTSRSLPEALQGFCARRGFGYVDLSESMLAANDAGVSTRWRHDVHFNRAGNEIFARAMFEWLAPRLDQGGSRQTNP